MDCDSASPFIAPETSPEIERLMVDLTCSVSLDAAIACYRAKTAADFCAEMARTNVPPLVFHADINASAPLQLTGRPTVALIPGGRSSISTKARRTACS
jgi:non-heme chloroperoxidase